MDLRQLDQKLEGITQINSTLQDKQSEWSFYVFLEKVRTNHISHFYSSKQTNWSVISWVFDDRFKVSWIIGAWCLKPCLSNTFRPQILPLCDMKSLYSRVHKKIHKIMYKITSTHWYHSSTFVRIGVWRKVNWGKLVILGSAVEFPLGEHPYRFS